MQFGAFLWPHILGSKSESKTSTKNTEKRIKFTQNLRLYGSQCIWLGRDLYSSFAKKKKKRINIKVHSNEICVRIVGEFYSEKICGEILSNTWNCCRIQWNRWSWKETTKNHRAWQNKKKIAVCNERK